MHYESEIVTSLFQHQMSCFDKRNKLLLKPHSAFSVRPKIKKGTENRAGRLLYFITVFVSSPVICLACYSQCWWPPYGKELMIWISTRDFVWCRFWIFLLLSVLMLRVGYEIEPRHEKTCFVICEQQKRRLACASAQSDQRLCYSLPR